MSSPVAAETRIDEKQRLVLKLSPLAYRRLDVEAANRQISKAQLVEEFAATLPPARGEQDAA